MFGKWKLDEMFNSPDSVRESPVLSRARRHVEG